MILFLYLLIPVLAIVFFYFSVISRKTYQCPECGEKVKYVEHMDAQRCGMCGAPLSPERNQ